MKKTLLDRSHTDALRYFLRHDTYAAIDLPPYFSFSKLLSKLVLEKDLPLDRSALLSAKKFEMVNHSLLTNKDGRYAWRKLQLIHPVLYVSLVKIITLKNNWNYLKKNFKKLDCKERIVCTSIPVYSSPTQKQKALQVSNWIENTEQESIRQSLDFEYLFKTDITDCYGSIYTHSISWALHGKPWAKKDRSSKLLGNVIDDHLQAMNYGQTNGIPQGSVLMDFIAEIVLAFADKELFTRVTKAKIKKSDYHVIRFRDDYTVFVKKKNDGEEIIKILSSVLADLGMHLNTQKTRETASQPTEIIKPDKYHFLSIPVPQIILKEKELKEILLVIFQCNIKFSTSGAVVTRLTKIYSLFIKNYKKIKLHDHVGLSSILLSIAMTNPKCFPIIASFLSIIVNRISGQRQRELMSRIIRKAKVLPNYGLLEIWLQRIALKINFPGNFNEKICRVASLEIFYIGLFESSWIRSKNVINVMTTSRIFYPNKLKSMEKIIPEKETRLFDKFTPS